MVNQKGLFVKFKIDDSKQITGFVPKKQLFEQDQAAQNGDNKDDEDDDGEQVNGEKLKKYVISSELKG